MNNESDKDANLRQDVVELMPALRAYAYALSRNRHDADDLVQETLVKALANLSSFTPGTRLRAWLFTIMRNTFYNHASRSGREVTGLDVAASLQSPIEETQEWTMRGKELLEAINRLPNHYRETLVLVVVVGVSYEEAARLCDCEIGTIKSRVNRARSMIMTDLGGKLY
ncbi:sigma-70 family RNA polymerase sigma factor [Tropicimonas isoalkanivorans]|uniref:RNA polymerase sigma factor n=1 Tax=Tropicimonas isoalkanivorans TaxID=441112 RepID=A0A1I1R485_9RHOB|nr:sigma-70 family RNA polymerase sigma factor [Tropicimonas isoalkanivorans]SFD29017.1 RNA polymerase sigma-70 factor, ECF subfamily [Tropicimonas isoalkanivorans]